ncbi:hypothetical protein P8452_38101 [Trifolium repens]|nr:hypothetical protein P8452_38101 [Trifolium repens]
MLLQTHTQSFDSLIFFLFDGLCFKLARFCFGDQPLLAPIFCFSRPLLQWCPSLKPSCSRSHHSQLSQEHVLKVIFA